MNLYKTPRNKSMYKVASQSIVSNGSKIYSEDCFNRVDSLPLLHQSQKKQELMYTKGYQDKLSLMRSPDELDSFDKFALSHMQVNNGKMKLNNRRTSNITFSPSFKNYSRKLDSPLNNNSPVCRVDMIKDVVDRPGPEYKSYSGTFFYDYDIKKVKTNSNSNNKISDRKYDSVETYFKIPKYNVSDLKPVKREEMKIDDIDMDTPNEIGRFESQKFNPHGETITSNYKNGDDALMFCRRFKNPYIKLKEAKMMEDNVIEPYSVCKHQYMIKSKNNEKNKVNLDDLYSGQFFRNKVLMGNKGLITLRKSKEKSLNRVSESKSTY